jgi:hypothetical protein
MYVCMCNIYMVLLVVYVSAYVAHTHTLWSRVSGLYMRSNTSFLLQASRTRAVLSCPSVGSSALL